MSSNNFMYIGLLGNVDKKNSFYESAIVVKALGDEYVVCA